MYPISLFRPASCRVSWLMLGNVLTVEEVRHA